MTYLQTILFSCKQIDVVHIIDKMVKGINNAIIDSYKNGSIVSKDNPILYKNGLDYDLVDPLLKNFESTEKIKLPKAKDIEPKLDELGPFALIDLS